MDRSAQACVKPLKRRPIFAITTFVSSVLAMAPSAQASQASITDTTLRITTDPAGELISLRLMSGDPGILEVDRGDDGTADQAFSMAAFLTIEFNGVFGDDALIIDETNGVFTDTKSTTMDGGAGFDLIIAGSGRETLYGGEDDDLIFGGPSMDSIDGEQGHDYVDGEGGNDSIFGGNGDHALLGAEDNDTVDGGPGADLLASEFDLALETPSADDILKGFLGNDVVSGGPGNDTLSGDLGEDTLDGETGIDTVSEFGDMIVLTDTSSTGSEGVDTLKSIERANLQGGGGTDWLDASAFTGDATINGNAGPDFISAGPGSDILIGGLHDDQLKVGADVDFVLTDTAVTGAGFDMVDGFETLVVTGGPGANRIDASALTATVYAHGGAGDDVLISGPAHSYLIGETGHDSLIGGGGRDRLYGGAGRDRMFGGPSTDSSTGAGARIS